MATNRGAGTEIVRSILLEDVNSTARILIYGAQHHIYTVLSITAHAVTLNADKDYIQCYLTGYDSVVGESTEQILLFQNDMSLAETFVWNDKFSFNGSEPTDYLGPMDSIVKQDAICDQGAASSQLLYIKAEDPSDTFDITCSYIDQNNN